jgi:F1F0 ATPase subunit 2
MTFQMANEIPGLFLSVLGGLVLGTAFFGGLWWTVRRGLASSKAGLWFTGSFLLRTMIVIMGFWFIAQGDWRRMASCVAGFLAARIVMVRLTRLKAGT